MEQLGYGHGLKCPHENESTKCEGRDKR